MLVLQRLLLITKRGVPMRKLKKIYIIFIILLLGIIITGCSDKGSEEEDKSETQSVPSALEQVQQQSDEIVTSTMEKDWAGSLEKAKELQSTWNELYPDIQKQGVKQEDVDAFVASLNTLTDHLISQTLNLSQKSAEEEKKDEQTPGQEQEQKSEQASEGENKEEESGEKESQGQEQEQKSEQASEEENKEENKEEKSEEQDSQEQAQSTESQSAEQEKKDPKTILSEIDPIISASEEDLVIINSSVEVTKFVPKFMSLFETPVPPNIFKLKYLVYHLHVASKLGDWDIVSADFKSVTETWESVQSKVLETGADLKTQLAQSINELEDVINSENANLTGVKCNFIIEQIKSLTEKIKEKEAKKEEEKK